MKPIFEITADPLSVIEHSFYTNFSRVCEYHASIPVRPVQHNGSSIDQLLPNSHSLEKNSQLKKKRFGDYFRPSGPVLGFVRKYKS